MSLYTIGNWTVDEMITPASSALQTPSVATLTRAEYSVKSANDDLAVLINNTGSGLNVAEELRFGAREVSDAYSGSTVPSSQRISPKTGVNVLEQIKLTLKATNSVSGEERHLPFKAYVNFQTLQSDIVTIDAVEYVLRRLIGAMLIGTSGTEPFAERVLAIARGDYDPSNNI